MMRYVLFFLFLIFTSVGSFFLALHFFTPDGMKTAEESAGPTLEIMPINDWVGKLLSCSTQSRDDSGIKCSPIASQLIRNLRRPENLETRLNDKGLFSLYLIENKLIYLKSNCTSSDISADLFAINYYPKDINLLPEKRKQKGLTFFNQASSFKKNGFRIDGSCLLVSVLKVNEYAIKHLLTGQYDKGWKWKVVWKFS